MSFFEYLNFLFGAPFSTMNLAPETVISAALFSIPLIWTVWKLVLNSWIDLETPPVNHSPSSPTRKAA
jgi:hypothetical protein